MRLSVLIPVHNERQTLDTIVERVMKVAKPYEIIVVDDGSSDGSRRIAEQLQKKYPESLRAIAHPHNMGKGAALRTALAQATGDVVMMQDADLEYHPEDYPSALRLIEQGHADAVYGSRFLGPHRATRRTYKRTINVCRRSIRSCAPVTFPRRKRARHD